MWHHQCHRQRGVDRVGGNHNEASAPVHCTGTYKRKRISNGQEVIGS
jgi:hypothetical protein